VGHLAHGAQFVHAGGDPVIAVTVAAVAEDGEGRVGEFLGEQVPAGPGCCGPDRYSSARSPCMAAAMAVSALRASLRNRHSPTLDLPIAHKDPAVRRKTGA
jgi:hypothetical protein